MSSYSKMIAGAAGVAVVVVACSVAFAAGPDSPAATTGSEHPKMEQPKMEHPSAAAGMEKKADMTQSVYACPHCHTMAMKAGKCPMCQMDMTQTHVLGLKDGQAMVCACAAGCKCDAKGAKDGKCSCGKEVMTVSTKDMYVCACPGGGCCTSISDKPGKCACGKDLKKSE